MVALSRVTGAGRFRAAVGFHVGEEEQLVLEDRSAQAAAGLVLVEPRRAGQAVALVRERHRNQRVALPVFVGFAVESVGAAARDDLELAAAVAAELGGVRLRLHLEFAGGFGSHAIVAEGHAGIVIVDSVQQEIVVAGALPVDGDAGGTGSADRGGGQQR